MRTINKVMLTLTTSVALGLPLLAQNNKVHVKAVKVIDGDSTVIEKDIDESELPGIEKELSDVQGKNVKVMLHVEKRDAAGRMKTDEHFSGSKDSIPGCKMARKKIIIGNDTMVFMAPELKDDFFHLEFPGDEMMSGFSYDIDNANGKERVIVRMIGPDSAGKMVIKKVEGKPGDDFNEDVIVRSKDGKTMHKVIVTTRARIEDTEKDESRSSKKEKSDLKLNELRLYPNPSDGKFTIEFESEGKQPITITITDMNGKQVQKQEVKGEGRHNLWFNLSKEGKGAYILNLQQGKKSITRKIVIE